MSVSTDVDRPRHPVRDWSGSTRSFGSASRRPLARQRADKFAGLVPVVLPCLNRCAPPRRPGGQRPRGRATRGLVSGLVAGDTLFAAHDEDAPPRSPVRPSRLELERGTREQSRSCRWARPVASRRRRPTNSSVALAYSRLLRRAPRGLISRFSSTHEIDETHLIAVPAIWAGQPGTRLARTRAPCDSRPLPLWCHGFDRR